MSKAFGTDGGWSTLDREMARKSLFLFWELWHHASTQHRFDAIRTLVFPAAGETDWWTEPSARDDFLQQAMSQTPDGSRTLLRCVVGCRILDHVLQIEDPLQGLGFDEQVQPTVPLSVELPGDSSFVRPDPGGGVHPVRANFQAVPRPHGWPRTDRARRQGDFGRFVIRNHVIVPGYAFGYEVCLQVPPATRSDLLFRSGTGLEAVATAHVHAGVRSWPVTSAGTQIGFNPSDGINPGERADEICAAVSDHFRNGSNLIVFPELSVCQATVDRAAYQLRYAHGDMAREAKSRLCLIGSMHTLEATDGGSQRNRAVLMWGDGRIAIFQDKLRAAIVQDFSEDISNATRMTLLLTPLGLAAILICRDFCDVFPWPGQQLTETLELGFILVPSMGGRTTESAHQEILSQVQRRHGPAVVISQQADHPKSEHFAAILPEAGMKRDDPDNPKRSSGWQQISVSQSLVARPL